MLDIALAPLALQPGTFNVGETIRVTVSFKYVVGVNATVKLRAGPYYTGVFGKRLVNPCIGSADVPLAAASSPTPQSASVDFTLVPAANGGIEDGVYGLRVWIEDTSAVAEQDDVITVTGNPGKGDMFSAMMPLLMVAMMMGTVMPMVQQMGDGGEE